MILRSIISMFVCKKILDITRKIIEIKTPVFCSPIIQSRTNIRQQSYFYFIVCAQTMTNTIFKSIFKSYLIFNQMVFEKTHLAMRNSYYDTWTLTKSKVNEKFFWVKLLGHVRLFFCSYFAIKTNYTSLLKVENIW